MWLKIFAKCNNFAICTCYFAKLLHKTPYFRKILCYFIAFVKILRYLCNTKIENNINYKLLKLNNYEDLQ